MRTTLKSIFILISLCLVFNSCVLNKTKDTERETCELHGKMMHKTLVRAIYGKAYIPRNTDAYPHAKSKKSMGCVVYKPRYRYAIVWSCSKCTKLKHKDKSQRDKFPD